MISLDYQAIIQTTLPIMCILIVEGVDTMK